MGGRNGLGTERRRAQRRGARGKAAAAKDDAERTSGTQEGTGRRHLQGRADFLPGDERAVSVGIRAANAPNGPSGERAPGISRPDLSNPRRPHRSNTDARRKEMKREKRQDGEGDGGARGSGMRPAGDAEGYIFLAGARRRTRYRYRPSQAMDGRGCGWGAGWD
jgi:hypothetical protein